MAAWPFGLGTEPDFLKQIGGALEHFRLAQHVQAAHRDHYVFLRGKILEQEVELENEAEQLVSLPGQGVVDQVRDRFVFDRDLSAVSVVEETQDVEERALAAS